MRGGFLSKVVVRTLGKTAAVMEGKGRLTVLACGLVRAGITVGHTGDTLVFGREGCGRTSIHTFVVEEQSRRFAEGALIATAAGETLGMGAQMAFAL